MKKLLSLVLITTLLLGNAPMEAGNKLKKSWAYTKIGLGVGSLLASPYLLFRGITGWWEKESAEEAYKNQQAGRPVKWDTPTNWKGGFNNGCRAGFNQGCGWASPLSLSLGILFIKGGSRDLRRVRKAAKS